EGPNFVPEQANRSDQVVIFQHGNNKKRPYFAKLNSFDIRRKTFLQVLFFCCKISCVDRRFGRYQAPEKCSRSGTNRREFARLRERWRRFVRRHEVKSVAIPSED